MLQILPGVWAFHLAGQDSYGRTGLGSLRLFFGGLVLAIIGQTWEYVLFGSWGRPRHGAGFMAQLPVILLMTVGLPFWAAANFHSLTGWRLILPDFVAAVYRRTLGFRSRQ